VRQYLNTLHLSTKRYNKKEYDGNSKVRLGSKEMFNILLQGKGLSTITMVLSQTQRELYKGLYLRAI
jgi:hypothetical protein